MLEILKHSLVVIENKKKKHIYFLNKYSFLLNLTIKVKQIFYSNSINSKSEFQRNNKQNTQSKIIILLLFLLLQKKKSNNSNTKIYF